MKSRASEYQNPTASIQTSLIYSASKRLLHSLTSNATAGRNNGVIP
jgi:hypothetical protein